MSDVGEGGDPEKKFILFWASGTGPVSRICAMGVDFLSDFCLATFLGSRKMKSAVLLEIGGNGCFLMLNDFFSFFLFIGGGVTSV